MSNPVRVRTSTGWQDLALVGPPGPQGPPGATGSGAGDVSGPASSVADRIAVYSGTSGKVIKDGGKTLTDITTDLNTGLATKAPTVHAHAQGDVTNLVSDLALKAPLASPVLTGNPTAPTPTAGDNDTSIATTAFVNTSVAAYAAPNTNVVINGDFRVNQIGYASAAVLAAGSYGHDQWKAGASGGDYTFTQLKSSTQITIASGKSLIQPIEDVNISGGSYVLSWTGTAQARAGVNTLTPSGAYAASPLPIAGQTAGTAMSVEFNAGTLGTVKLERGSVATPFIMRPYDQELLTCQRYYQRFGEAMVSCDNAASVGALFYGAFLWKPIMRATPTVNIYTMSAGNAGTASLASVSADVVNVQAQAAALGGAWVSLSIHGAARL
jgi:hypothetical protein